MPKQITAPQIIIELQEDPEISDFLSYQKKSTQHTYTSYFRRLKEFYDVTGKEMLSDPKLWKKKIFGFKRWLQNQGYSEYYIQSATGAVRGFFAHNGLELKFNRSDRKKLRERSRKTEDYLLDRQDISKMAMVGNLRERYVLLVGKSLGFRASDFVNLTYGKFRGLKLDNDAPICIGRTVTQKEHVPAYPFLDSDSVPIIKAILEANKDRPDNEFILMTKSKKKHNTYQKMQDAELSHILQSLAKRCKLEHGDKRVRFHCMRKYLIDRLSSVMSESKWKAIAGKKVSESAYVGTNSLREDYLRAMPSIAISTNSNNGKVSELEKKIDRLNRQLEFYKEENEKSEAERNHAAETYYSEIIQKLEDRILRLEGKKLSPLEQKKRKGWID